MLRVECSRRETARAAERMMRQDAPGIEGRPYHAVPRFEPPAPLTLVQMQQPAHTLGIFAQLIRQATGFGFAARFHILPEILQQDP